MQESIRRVFIFRVVIPVRCLIGWLAEDYFPENITAQLKTIGWKVKPLEITSVHSSFFEDRLRFPNGSIEFDHALIMRDVRHEWHAAEDLHAR